MPAPLDPAGAPEGPHVDADAITNRSFATAFRGWDQDEVRVHLVAVADQVRALLQHQDELERRLAEATAMARRANTADLDPAEVAKVLGEETARVLSTAREAAAEMQAKAEEKVAALVRQGTDEAERQRREAAADAAEVRRRAAEDAAATRSAGEEFVAELRAGAEQDIEAHRAAVEAELAEMRQAARDDAALVQAEADEAAARLREEAEVAAERARTQADDYDRRIRTEADAYAAQTRLEAEAHSDRRRAESEAEASRVVEEATQLAAQHRQSAEAELAEARSRAASLVDEAQVVRERVLADLAKRRKAARQHLEQLRAARERLLSAYEVVRNTVEAATTELQVVLPEAKVAADDAARRVASEPEPSVEELEAELAAARDAGLPIVAPPMAERGAADEIGGRSEELAGPDVDDEGLAGAEAADQSGREAAAGAEADTPAGAESAVASTTGPDGDGVAHAVSPDAAPEAGAAAGAAAEANEAGAEASPQLPPTAIDLRAASEARRRNSRRFRKHRDPLGGEELPPGSLSPVETGADFEAVKVIDTGEVPVVSAETPAEAAGEPAAEELPADVAAEELAMEELAVDVAAEELAAEELAAEELAAEELAAAGEDDSVPDVAGPVGRAGGEAAVGESPGGAVPAPDVDALFARLRAERSEDEGAAPTGADADRAPAEAARTAAQGPADAGASSGAAVPGEPVADTVELPAATAGTDQVGGAPQQPGEVGEVGEVGEPGEPDELDPEAAAAASLLEKRDGVLAEVEQRLAKKLKRVLSDEQSALLDAVRRARKPTADAVLVEPGAQVEAYASAALDELRAASVAGVRFAGDVDDSAAESADTDVEPFARALAEGFAQPLRQRIERALAEPGEQGEADAADPVDELELADRLRAVYREWRSQRLGDAVADAVLAAFSAGMFDAMPEGCGLRWLFDEGFGPCPDAEDNVLAGSVVKGSPFPTGHACPPAHAGCRCMVLPEAMVTDKGVKAPVRGSARR